MWQNYQLFKIHILNLFLIFKPTPIDHENISIKIQFFDVSDGTPNGKSEDGAPDGATDNATDNMGGEMFDSKASAGMKKSYWTIKKMDKFEIV